MANPKVVIFNDTHGWHSEQLVKALKKHQIESVLTDLAECRIDLDSPTGMVIPGFDHQLPAAAIVRGIAPGTLEQITLRMDILHTLAELDIAVMNSAATIERTVDKARTSILLHLAGINTPKTWACEDRNIAIKIASKYLQTNDEIVVKPLFGCMGKGVTKISSIAELQKLEVVGDAFYLQEYVQPYQQDHWQDWRIMVIDNQVCAAMTRHADQWITNFAQGAQCQPTELNQTLTDIAIAATQAVNADYAGVDIIQDKDGNYSVLEVNSVPAWKGLLQATGINAADMIVEAVTKRIALC